MEESNTDIKLGLYRHFKGGEYQVVLTAIDSETLQTMVIYVGVNDNKTWVRPLGMFNQEVDYKGVKVKRFTYIG